MTPELLHLQTRMAPFLGKRRLDLCLNNNRQTMVRVVSLSFRKALLSVHKIFVQAPDAVLQALVHFVYGAKKDQQSAKKVIRKFIEEALLEVDLAEEYPQDRIQTKGKLYDLKEIFQTINKDYFCNELDLRITWYGQKMQKRKRSMTFGEYLRLYRLIKIHRQLDQAVVPDFYVSFVVYHEMLHAVIPPYMDRAGRMRMHGAEFKQREREFAYFQDAMEWEKANPTVFFK